MTSLDLTPTALERSPTVIASEIFTTRLLAFGVVISVRCCSLPGSARFFRRSLPPGRRSRSSVSSMSVFLMTLRFFFLPRSTSLARPGVSAGAGVPGRGRATPPGRSPASARRGSGRAGGAAFLRSMRPRTRTVCGASSRRGAAAVAAASPAPGAGSASISTAGASSSGSAIAASASSAVLAAISSATAGAGSSTKNGTATSPTSGSTSTTGAGSAPAAGASSGAVGGISSRFRTSTRVVRRRMTLARTRFSTTCSRDVTICSTSASFSVTTRSETMRSVPIVTDALSRSPSASRIRAI